MTVGSLGLVNAAEPRAKDRAESFECRSGMGDSAASTLDPQKAAAMYRTDAHALQAILRVINDPESGGTYQARWEAALGVEYRGLELFRGHAEVVQMLNETIKQIYALPEHKQSNYIESVSQWWLAVVVPDVQWGARATSRLIGDEHIAILGSLGDVVESRLDKTTSAPGGLNVAGVQEQCQEWLALLESTDIPTNLRDMLVQGIEHLLWLIANADRFGYARVARTAEDLTGQLALTGAQLAPELKATWRERMTQWGAGLMLFNGLVASTNLAIDQSADLIDNLAPAVVQVVDAVTSDEDEQAS